MEMAGVHDMVDDARLRIRKRSQCDSGRPSNRYEDLKVQHG